MYNKPETAARREIQEKHPQMKKMHLQSSDEPNKNNQVVCRVVTYGMW